ncbi:hypothetical protein GCM10009111_33750 [Colwellia asteriadis]|uniref:Histidine phosphatase family protein n=1 Tax=Colwellia asteriadis TaxID=517723 RepID=A0ABN1LB43_9GAMM
MMKLILLFVSLSFSLSAYSDNDFSLYLVRHAEKQSDKDNPSLTSCGLFRAKQLATMLSETGINKVYSTSYQRTLQTATPFAMQSSLSVKHYSPKNLADFAFQLKQQQQSSLIVGHSNTTPKLVELLTGKKVTKLSEDNYQMLYQIQFINNEVILTVLKQPLQCK